MEVIDTQNQSSARADRASDAEGRAVPGPLELKDLALPPGDYVLSISGSNGDYLIESSETEPPKVTAGTAAEREPNDRAEDAQLLSEGERLSAEISSSSDADHYRLSLSSPKGVAIRLDPAETCPAVLKLTWDTWNGGVVSARATAPGFVYEGLLRAGDYLIRIEPDMQCGETRLPYSIGFDLAPDLPNTGDIEPNDSFNDGRPMPNNMSVDGFVGQFSDDDWFTLPRVASDTEATLRVTGDVYIELTDGKAMSSGIMAPPTLIASGDPLAAAAGVIPAGAAAAIRVTKAGEPSAYKLEIEMASATAIAKGPAAASTPPAALEAKLAFDETEIAAFWHRGQRLTGTLSLLNSGETSMEAQLSAATLPPGWRLDAAETASVGPGQTATIPLSLDIEPDVYAARALRVSVAASVDGSRPAVANADIGASVVASPVGDHLSFRLPADLLGGFNVAWSGLGGELLRNDQISDADGLQSVNDNLGSNAGFLVDATRLPLEITIRFGGGRVWPISGVTINPQTPGVWPTEYIKDFELLLSEDGETFEPALSGMVGTEPREQVFLLPEERPAMAARLRVLSNNDGNLGRVGFSEWKVIADPAVGIGAGLDIADTQRGGHIVWSRPLISDQLPIIKGVLEAGDIGPVTKVAGGVKAAFVVGFNENRAAQIAALEWTESALDIYAQHMPGVVIEASTESPLGPWTPIGEFAISGEGQVKTSFDPPVWARFLRFTSTRAAAADGETVQFPTSLRIEERVTDGTYRSILGEWGQYSPVSFYETTLPEPPTAKPEGAANDTRESAEPLEIGQTVSGRIELGTDEDWFKVVQPDGFDLMTITVGGEPTVGAEIALFDEKGAEVPLSASGGSVYNAILEARVEPGRTYYLRAAQPPHSVIIAYDTSGSLLSFIPIIFNALDVFSSGVTPGREALNFLPFDRAPLLADFSDQKTVLKQALAKDARESTTSGLEATTITALRELAKRRGERALLLITDASTSTGVAHSDMWTLIEQVRPRIFAAHVGNWDDPMREKQLLQDAALAAGGHYASSRSQGELDVAFDRVAAWLRRPASYTLKVEPGEAAPPEPGQLVVTGEATAVVNSEAYSAEPASEAAIEIVLDASGSMLKRMDGRRRIEIARNSLNKLVMEELERDHPVAIRVFGHDRPGSCETALLQPLSPLDPDAAVSMISTVEPQNLAKTPIAASLRMVGEDLAGVPGRKTVVLITDGEETCGGDPRAEIQALAARDIDVRVNIVGFAVDDAALKGEFAEWARIGRGRYFDAGRPEELDAAVKAATELPYQIFGPGGALVGTGLVGGEPVVLPAGSYRVEVATSPPTVFESVVVREKQTTELEAGAS
jgi:hypothetical protein